MHADFFSFTDEIWPVLPHGLACIDYGALNAYLNIFHIYAVILWSFDGTCAVNVLMRLVSFLRFATLTVCPKVMVMNTCFTYTE